jgi:Tol biopolymer transport system component
MPAEPTPRLTPRASRLAALALAALAAALLSAPHALAAPANYEGISGDGVAAFFTTTDKLVPGDTDSRRDVYVRSFDSALGSYVTREVSTGPTGGNDAFDAFFEKTSADGAKVFFSTDESLVAADADHETDVYLRDLAKGTTALVSQGDGACAPACGNGSFPAGFAGATADGAEALFVTGERLTAADTDSAIDVYERDLLTGTTTLVSAGGSPCPPGCGNGEFNATLRGISADGSRAFFATSEQLVNADTDTAIDIYVRDLPGGPTTLVSQGDSSCAPACGNSDSSPAVFAGSSEDGAEVFFETSEGLVAGDEDGANDVYRRAGGATTLISGGTQAQPANFAAASDDGGEVLFVTAEPLVKGDTNAATDVYEWTGGAPALVTSGKCCGSTFGAATGDGTKVTFTTTEQLAAADTDASADVYEREVGGGSPTLISQGAASCAPSCGNGAASAIFNGASADASRVFFTTTEQLVAQDGDSKADIYVRDLEGSTTELVSFPGVFCPTPGGCDAIFNGASADGVHVFFQTTERLTEGDVDSEIDVYERAAGQTRLVSTGNSVELGPATPVLTGTSPASPEASTTPAILGQADPETLIKLYATPDCSGAPAATGSSLELGGAGITVTVAAGSTTSFRATATDENGDTSACSGSISYRQEDAPPPSSEEPAPGKGSDSGGGSGAGSKQGDGSPHVTPHTRITFAPAGKTRARRPVFRFTDSTGQEGTSFQCKVDRHSWRPCGSPQRLKRLNVGRHVFRVRATNAVGEIESTPQARKFKLVAR